MLPTLPEIVTLLSVYKYLIIFPVAIAEGPIIAIICGFLVSQNILNFIFAYIVLILGDLVGDSFYYFLGYFGRAKYVKKILHFFGLTDEKIIYLENHFEKHTYKTLVLGKLTYGIETPFLVSAGLAKVPYWTFIFCCLLPTIPKTLFFLVIGFYFGKAYEALNKYLEYASLVSFALIIFAIFVYVIIRRRKK